MKFIGNRLHSVVDYLTVLLFGAAPFILDFSSIGKALCFTLAGAHLFVTLITDFPGGILKLLSIKFHGWIELLVGIALIVASFGIFPETRIDHLFFLGTGVLVLLVWACSQYRIEN